MKDQFPGFQACMRMMRKHDAMTAEDGFQWLLARADQFVDELLAELHNPANEQARLGFWLLELLAEAKSPKLFPLFLEWLYGPDSLLRSGALLGLSQLDTKEARRALWEAQSHALPDAKENEQFHQELGRFIEHRAP
jgi:hypothetical protein